jgi:predicted RNA-binding protein with RPS1 domain
VFVELNRSRVSGLVHISQIGTGFVKDLATHYSPGQAVTVRVLSVDRDNNKVNLSMKPELLVADDEDDEVEETADGVTLPVGSRKRSSAAVPDMDDEMVQAAELENSSSEGEGEGTEDDEGDEEEEEDDEEDEEEEDEVEEAEDVGMDDMELSEGEADGKLVQVVLPCA